MKDLIINKELPLPNHCRYKGFAFDGCHYYFTCPGQCEIRRYSSDFCKIDCEKVQRAYTAICFDPIRNCLWAAAEGCHNKLFRLDLCLQEIDSIRVYSPEKCNGVIVGISYDCHNDRLLIAFTNCILSMSLDNSEDCSLLQRSACTWNMGILSVSPCYIVTKSCCQTIEIYGESGEMICEIQVPPEFTVEAILLDTCHCLHHHFFVLATKNYCYPYLLECDFPCPKMDFYPCNYAMYRDVCCNEYHCGGSPRACDDILESIALIETALSHILNAEGEKLQKIIASTEDVEKILCANKAIDDTLVYATHLEIVLHDKLAAVTECCRDHCRDCPRECCKTTCNESDCLSPCTIAKDASPQIPRLCPV
ncbi:MAG: hypothetical protein RSC76_04355 [Oscillospiraceae bacterium]